MGFVQTLGQSVWIQPQALTGNSRNEAKGPQYPEGSQGLHVKPPTLLRWRSCYHIYGVQSKSEETAEEENKTLKHAKPSPSTQIKQQKAGLQLIQFYTLHFNL